MKHILLLTLILNLIPTWLGSRAASPYYTSNSVTPTQFDFYPNGSTYTADAFDAVMHSISAGTALSYIYIFLHEGNYETRGPVPLTTMSPVKGFQVKSYWRIVGDDARPTIKMVYNGVNNVRIMGTHPSSPTLVTNTAIYNLILDGDWDNLQPTAPAQPNYQKLEVQGIGLEGTENRLDNISVINAGSNTQIGGIYTECFVMYLGNYHGTHDSTDNYIYNCTVSQFRGAGYCSAISLNGWKSGGTIYGVAGRVDACSVSLSGAGQFGYNVTYSVGSIGGCTFYGNSYDGYARGFSNDTGENDGLTLDWNTFYVYAGDGMSIGSSHNSTARHNYFILNATIDNALAIRLVGSGVNGAGNSGHPDWDQGANYWSFDSNDITNAGGYREWGILMKYNCDGNLLSAAQLPTNISIENTTISAGYGIVNANGRDVWNNGPTKYNTFDSNGNYSGLEDNADY